MDILGPTVLCLHLTVICSEYFCIRASFPDSLFSRPPSIIYILKYFLSSYLFQIYSNPRASPEFIHCVCLIGNIKWSATPCHPFTSPLVSDLRINDLQILEFSPTDPRYYFRTTMDQCATTLPSNPSLSPPGARHGRGVSSRLGRRSHGVPNSK